MVRQAAGRTSNGRGRARRMLVVAVMIGIVEAVGTAGEVDYWVSRKERLMAGTGGVMGPFCPMLGACEAVGPCLAGGDADGWNVWAHEARSTRGEGAAMRTFLRIGSAIPCHLSKKGMVMADVGGLHLFLVP